MIKQLVCKKHGVRCCFDEAANTREFDLPLSGPPRMCALLLASTPAAGTLYVKNEAGGQTAYFCSVIEEVR